MSCRWSIFSLARIFASKVRMLTLIFENLRTGRFADFFFYNLIVDFSCRFLNQEKRSAHEDTSPVCILSLCNLRQPLQGRLADTESVRPHHTSSCCSQLSELGTPGGLSEVRYLFYKLTNQTENPLTKGEFSDNNYNYLKKLCYN